MNCGGWAENPVHQDFLLSVCMNIEQALERFKNRIGINDESKEPPSELYMHLPKLQIFASKKISLVDQKKQLVNFD